MCPLDTNYVTTVFNAYRVSARYEVYEGFVCLRLGREVKVCLQVRPALLYSHKKFSASSLRRCH